MSCLINYAVFLSLMTDFREKRTHLRDTQTEKKEKTKMDDELDL